MQKQAEMTREEQIELAYQQAESQRKAEKEKDWVKADRELLHIQPQSV